MKRVITPAIVLLAALSLSSCIERAEVKSFIRPVKVTTAESMSHLSRSYTGTVQSDEVSDLAFKMPGQVITLAVEEGQIVKRGQLIAKIDPTDYNLQLQSAKANFKNTESQMVRFKSLLAKDAISLQQYEAIEASYVRDQSSLENAENMLSETQIYAPFTGVVVNKYIDNYQRVQAMQAVVRVINPTNIEVAFTLPESNIRYMSASQKRLAVNFDAIPGKSFKAKLNKFVDISVDGSGAPVTVVINDDTFEQYRTLIRPGFSCNVTLTIDDASQEGSVYIPTSAITNKAIDNNSGVWVYNPTTSCVELKRVQIEELFGTDYVIIKSGLKSGDKVVSAGASMLVEGQKVKLLKE